MRIEMNSGGLDGLIAITQFQSDMNDFISKTSNVIDSFKAVKQQTYQLNGGVGNLRSAVNNVENRIDREDEKRETAISMKQKYNSFLDLAIRVDKKVAALVNKNKKEFYRVNPWLKPSPFYPLPSLLISNYLRPEFWLKAIGAARAFIYEPVRKVYKTMPTDWLYWTKTALGYLGEKIPDELERMLHPYRMLRFDEKFGFITDGIGIAGAGTGVMENLVKFYQTMNDADRKVTDKISQGIELIKSVFDLGGNLYTTIKCSAKELKVVFHEGMNQILDIPQLKYVLTEEAKALADKVNTIVAVLDVGFATISGTIRQAGKSIEDGFQLQDIPEILIGGSTTGLTEVIEALSLGWVHIDAENAVDALLRKANSHTLENDPFMRVFRETNNPIIIAPLAVADGAWILAETVMDGLRKICIEKVVEARDVIGSYMVRGTNSRAAWRMMEVM